MDRRGFLKATGTVIAGATLSPSTFGGSQVRNEASDCAGDAAGGPVSGAAMPGTSSSEGRLVLPINRNWRYNRDFVEGAHEREFDDSKFERVVVPHTNVRLPWHSFDDKTYEFVSIYRRRFKLPAEARGRHVFVDFEGTGGRPKGLIR